MWICAGPSPSDGPSPVGAAREEAEEVRLKALREDVRARHGFEMDRHGPGGLQDLRRELALGRGDRLGGDLGEPRGLHRISVERSNASNLSPRNQRPTAASPARISSAATVARTTPVLTPRTQNDAM